MAEKPHLNLIFVGHIDHGKSTTVGAIKYASGQISEQEMKKLQELAKQYNRPTFEFAFYADTLKEERERGITIDIQHIEFETPKYYFTIIDAPGHQDFVKNMITGASQADAAFLVVAAAEGVQEQTREHIQLLKILGVDQVVVGINKMDLVNYQQSRYEEIKQEVMKLLKMVGYDITKINFVPYSALKLENITKKSENMPWYTGPTVMEALDQLKEPPKAIDKPLRMPLEDVLSVQGFGTIPVGVVEYGTLKPGDQIVIMPQNIKAEIKSIEMHHKPLPQAIPGDNIGISLKGNVEKNAIGRGSVIGPASNPPTVAKEFLAQIVVLNHPTAIAPGYTPVFHIHTAQVACEITEIVEKKDPKTGQTIEKNPQFIKNGDVAIVKVKPTRPVVAEKVQDFPKLGRFAIRDMGRTIGAGMILDITSKA